MKWRIHHRDVTVSTNLDAREGDSGDVFTAGLQTAGRGRLDHKWLSAPGENLTMSAVLSVAGLTPEHVATLPIAVGLSVIEGLERLADSEPLALKWPNDVLWRGRKLAGILCERHGDRVIAGIGINVNQRQFPESLLDRAVSLCQIGRCGAKGEGRVPVKTVRDAVLEALRKTYEAWMEGGLAPFMERIGRVDYLKGKIVSIVQTDDDGAPVTGVCGGITGNGTLVVDGRQVWAGEAHVSSVVNNL